MGTEDQKRCLIFLTPTVIFCPTQYHNDIISVFALCEQFELKFCSIYFKEGESKNFKNVETKSIHLLPVDMYVVYYGR